jgi:hypothetical protein
VSQQEKLEEIKLFIFIRIVQNKDIFDDSLMIYTSDRSVLRILCLTLCIVCCIYTSIYCWRLALSDGLFLPLHLMMETDPVSNVPEKVYSVHFFIIGGVGLSP